MSFLLLVSNKKISKNQNTQEKSKYMQLACVIREWEEWGASVSFA